MKSYQLVITAFFFTFLLAFSGCLSDDVPVSPQEQLAKDVGLIDEYLKSNGITAIEDPSGVRYVVKTDTVGERPTVSDVIVFNYEGRFLKDNQIFDSGDTVEYQLSNLIAGWQIVFPNLSEGGSATLYIPSGYAYGPNGQGSIPGNSNLIFDVDLIEVK